MNISKFEAFLNSVEANFKAILLGSRDEARIKMKWRKADKIYNNFSN